MLWADEIVVVDPQSADSTRQMAESPGARVVQVPFNGFGDLRNRAIEGCRYHWIFSLDADERCTEPVRDKILALLSGSPTSCTRPNVPLVAKYEQDTLWLRPQWAAGTGPALRPRDKVFVAIETENNREDAHD
jgi:glycosyltransferase involved in cell wall biosynthesis